MGNSIKEDVAAGVAEGRGRGRGRPRAGPWAGIQVRVYSGFGWVRGSARGGAGNWEGPRDCERGSGLTCDWNVADGVVVSVPVAGSSFVKVGKILKRRK